MFGLSLPVTCTAGLCEMLAVCGMRCMWKKFFVVAQVQQSTKDYRKWQAYIRSCGISATCWLLNLWVWGDFASCIAHCMNGENAGLYELEAARTKIQWPLRPLRSISCKNRFWLLSGPCCWVWPVFASHVHCWTVWDACSLWYAVHVEKVLCSCSSAAVHQGL